ncbi:retrovirus-related pol polyprotein from transposon TNT 1-94 [Tanacetum coccineum]
MADSASDRATAVDEIHQSRQTKSLGNIVDKPFGKMVIKLKWLWKNKKDEDQTVIRNKARLVAKGYAQEEGIDFEESFAPVYLDWKLLRIFVCYAAHKFFPKYISHGRENGISKLSTEEVYRIMLLSREGSLVIKLRKLECQRNKTALQCSSAEAVYVALSARKLCSKFNPKIQPEPERGEDLPKDNPKLEIAVPLGFIYQNTDKKNKLIFIDELHKFSDGTLNDVRTALDDRLKGIRMKYLPQTIWRQSDRDKARAMIQAIDK